MGQESQVQVVEPLLWRRGTSVEEKVRAAIRDQPGLSIFGTGIDRGPGGNGEFFVTLTAASDAAREAASRLLDACSGLSEEDWSLGWQRLELGDWMIRVYPERQLQASAA